MKRTDTEGDRTQATEGDQGWGGQRVATGGNRRIVGGRRISGGRE